MRANVADVSLTTLLRRSARRNTGGFSFPTEQAGISPPIRRLHVAVINLVSFALQFGLRSNMPSLRGYSRCPQHGRRGSGPIPVLQPVPGTSGITRGFHLSQWWNTAKVAATACGLFPPSCTSSQDGATNSRWSAPHSPTQTTPASPASPCSVTSRCPFCGE